MGASPPRGPTRSVVASTPASSSSGENCSPRCLPTGKRSPTPTGALRERPGSELRGRTATMATLELKLRIYPNESEQQKNFPQFSWHRPAGIKIHLSDGKGKGLNLVTGPDGVAKLKVPKGKYKVSLPTLRGFTVGKPKSLKVAGADQSETVEAFPRKKYWLVPLRLTGTLSAGTQAAGVHGARVRLRSIGSGAKSTSFKSMPDGSVYAVCPAGEVRVRSRSMANLTPTQTDFVVRTDHAQEQIPVEYRISSARIAIRPELKPFGRNNAIPGVTFELTRAGQAAPLRQVTQGSQACIFSDLAPGPVKVRIIPPSEYQGKPIILTSGQDEVPVMLAAGTDWNLSSHFQFEYATGNLRGRVVDAEGQPAEGVDVVARLDRMVRK